LLFRYVVAERMGTIILSALLAHTGWHWMTDRGSQLLQYQFAWPAPDIALVATLMRWLMLMLIIAGAAWVLRVGFGKLAEWVRQDGMTGNVVFVPRSERRVATGTSRSRSS
ncbi:MAG: hypothetical protein V3T56_08495, partial [Gemmatimonadales bacterium]